MGKIFKHELEFIEPNFGRFEIEQPLEFDNFGLKISKKNENFRRDKVIGGEEVSLRFNRGLNHEIDLLLDAINLMGSESQVNYILTDLLDNTEVVMELDFEKAKYDGINNVELTTIQDTARAQVERRNDIKANVFSNTDTFGNAQTPLPKQKFWLKNQPILAESIYNTTPVLVVAESTRIVPAWINPPSASLGAFINFFGDVQKSQIDDTLTNIDNAFFGNDRQPALDAGNLNLITFATQAENVEIKITELECEFKHVNNGQFDQNPFSSVIWTVVLLDENNTAIESHVLQEISFSGNETQIGVFNAEHSHFIPSVQPGYSLAVFPLWFFNLASSNPDPFNQAVRENYSYLKCNKGKLTFTVRQLGIDTVIDAIRYEDFLKQGIKSASKLEAETSLFESGYFANQFVFNRQMMQRNPDAVLNFLMKDEAKDLLEICADYKFVGNKVKFDTFLNFYPLNEIAVFTELPDSEMSLEFNKRFLKKSVQFEYQNYDEDKDSTNTVNAFHTRYQGSTPNLKSDDALEIDINKIRDPYLTLTLQKEAAKETTLLATDDKYVVQEAVPVAPGTRGQVVSVFDYQIEASTGNLQLANNQTFTWRTLGFEVGNTIEITGNNAGNYTVVRIESRVLTLQSQTGAPTGSGKEVITIFYPLPGVQWMSRTNEGLLTLEGVPNKTANLKYSIKNNLLNTDWANYIATICKDRPTGKIVTTDFVANRNLRTQFQADKPILKEGDDIEVSSLPTPRLSKRTASLKIACSLGKAKDLFENVDNGFIRVLSNNGTIVRGWIKEATALFYNGILETTIELLNEPYYYEINGSIESGVTFSGFGISYIVGRELDWFEVNNDRVTVYDENYIPLISNVLISRVKINGVIYSDSIEFTQNLLTLTSEN